MKMQLATRKTQLGAALALVLSGAIASCGGTVRDGLGDSNSETGGASTVGASGASSGGGSKATGAGGKAGGSGAVGAGAVVGTAGKSGGAGTVGIGGKGGGAGSVAGGGKAGGVSGGKGGYAGVPAAGGVGGDICAGVRCGKPICPDGSPLYVPPGSCCPVCGPNCGLVDCAFPMCTPNEILSTPPGQCCPRCVPAPLPTDAGAPCNQAGYASLRQMLEDKYRMAQCGSDSQCTVVAVNVCGKLDCGVAMYTGVSNSFESNLFDYARSNCIGCGPAPGTCPPVFLTARCVSGYCVLTQ